MAKEDKFNPKGIMTIKKQSIVGAILFADSYEKFCALIKNTKKHCRCYW